MRWALQVAACLLLVAAYEVGAKRIKNGIRLVGGSGPKGRLEVLTSEPYFVPVNQTSAYIPVCDNGLDDSTAEIMCKLLGYNHGRKFYGPNINYDNTETDKPAGRLECVKKGKRGRRLRAISGSANDPHSSAGDRRSLSPLIGHVDIPAKAAFTCTFWIGDCDSTGPLAGIQCGAKIFPPAPSPPPLPPNPPPSPPPVSLDIKIIGGNTPPNGAYSFRSVEPNLCPTDDELFCQVYGRVELKVDYVTNGTSSKVFAPLCMPNDTNLLLAVGDIACQQSFDWPSLQRVPSVYAYANPSPTPFIVPQGKVMEQGDFNPAAVKAWVNVLGIKNGTRRVQDLDVKVLNTPCATGGLYALECQVLMRR